MKRILILSILFLCLMTLTAHGMFGKRRESKEQKDGRALLKTAQDNKPQTTRLPQANTSAHTGGDDPLSTQLRKVLKLSNHSNFADSTPDSSTSSIEGSSSPDHALFESPMPTSPPVASPTHRTLVRTRSHDSVLVPTDTPTSGRLPHIGNTLITAQEPKSPYHDRHMLGLMLQWLQKLPPENIDIVGGSLAEAQKADFIASLRSIATAVTTNIADDSADKEGLIIDLSKLVMYAPCATQPVQSSLRSSPLAHSLGSAVEQDPALTLLKESSPEEQKIRLLLKTTPHILTLWKDQDVVVASEEEKAKAREWIITTLQAIQIRKDPDTQKEIIGIDLAVLPQSTTPSTQKLASSGMETTSSSEGALWQILKGASLISLGYILSQLIHGLGK